MRTTKAEARVALVPPVDYGLADEPLVGERAIHVGGVQEGDADLYGPMYRCDGRVLVAGAVKPAHPHASQA
jgi:hypothetical protein